MKWIGVVLALCGCPVIEPETDAGSLPDGGACPSEVVLGTETEARTFAALVDGMELKIQAGPQGGWHVWVSVQASAMAQTGTLSYVLRSGTQVLSAPLRIELANAVLEPITCGWERRMRSPSRAWARPGAARPGRSSCGWKNLVRLRWWCAGA